MARLEEAKEQKGDKKEESLPVHITMCTALKSSVLICTCKKVATLTTHSQQVLSTQHTSAFDMLAGHSFRL